MCNITAKLSIITILCFCMHVDMNLKYHAIVEHRFVNSFWHEKLEMCDISKNILESVTILYQLLVNWGDYSTDNYCWTC